MIKTPKEKEIEKKKQEDAWKEKFKKHQDNFNFVVATPEGLDVFKYIMEACSFHKNTISANRETGEINTQLSHYLEARRSVYLELRKYISDKNLKRIEFK